MNDIIRQLPDSVANQIAAGEVIQRPASVIKELVENSIDAGADSVTIILKDAGRTLIQVIDNGSGMSDTDARMAFERHATSKISRADDLFTLNTMGFRGEALASIAAIAQVELRTMRRGETLGTRIVINGSRVESQEPEAGVPGSNMMVKNLFFNVPARRKFLKKDAVEMSAIMREFERLALVNIGVDFTLVSNDTTVHSLMHAPLKKRICDLFGKNLDKQLLPIETDTSIVSISGYIGLPENARKRNPLQFFMVNGRNMQHPYFRKAVLQCYDRLIPVDTQPNYFINLRVDPETIDVNIHPTKSEIKFENEQAIWQILTAAIRDSLGRFNVGPSLDFDREADVPEIPRLRGCRRSMSIPVIIRLWSRYLRLLRSSELKLLMLFVRGRRCIPGRVQALDRRRDTHVMSTGLAMRVECTGRQPLTGLDYMMTLCASVTRVSHRCLMLHPGWGMLFRQGSPNRHCCRALWLQQVMCSSIATLISSPLLVTGSW